MMRTPLGKQRSSGDAQDEDLVFFESAGFGLAARSSFDTNDGRRQGWPLVACEPADLSFDISATAGLYAQLAGVLAGFAFASLTLVISGAHRRASGTAKTLNEYDGRVVASLTTSF